MWGRFHGERSYLIPVVIGLGTLGFLAFNHITPSSATTQVVVSVEPVPAWEVGEEGRLVTTIAGGGPAETAAGGFRNGRGEEALFSNPTAIAVDSDGSLIVADFLNNRIRRIDLSGDVHTIAGTGEPGDNDGPASSATFNGPAGVTVDKAGNIFVSDAISHKIRRISPSGNVETIAGIGPAQLEKDGTFISLSVGGFRDGDSSEAQFNRPAGIAVDGAGNVYVADKDNHRIRMITPEGEVTTFAGSGKEGHEDGLGTRASFSFPVGLTIDQDGNLYASEQGYFSIRKIDPSGLVTTLMFAPSPSGLAGIDVDENGNVYVADGWANQIRLLRNDGSTVGLAGGERGYSDGNARTAEFGYVTGIAIGQDGTVFVTDSTNQRVRAISSRDTSPKSTPARPTETPTTTETPTPTTTNAAAPASTEVATALPEEQQ
jgi:sugar lactone lactonase YvrE